MIPLEIWREIFILLNTEEHLHNGTWNSLFKVSKQFNQLSENVFATFLSNEARDKSLKQKTEISFSPSDFKHDQSLFFTSENGGTETSEQQEGNGGEVSIASGNGRIGGSVYLEAGKGSFPGFIVCNSPTIKTVVPTNIVHPVSVFPCECYISGLFMLKNCTKLPYSQLTHILQIPLFYNFFDEHTKLKKNHIVRFYVANESKTNKIQIVSQGFRSFVLGSNIINPMQFAEFIIYVEDDFMGRMKIFRHS